MEARDPSQVRGEGLTIIKDASNATVDIVFVHGLGGHPYHTWACKPLAPPPQTTDSLLHGDGQAIRYGRRVKYKHRFQSLLSRWKGSSADVSARSVHSTVTTLVETPVEDHTHPFWPADFLATEQWCQDARILTYGYNSKVTEGYAGTNKSSLFAHAKDLLFELQREKLRGRPVVFVAHSLGGLVVKEALRRSHMSGDEDLKDIVQSTLGIIFLGTPHRGSPDLAGVGDAVRRVAELVLRIDTNPTLLRALGTDSPELDIGREEFPVLWRTYHFHVKTFQEAFGMSGVKLGGLSEKVVPDISSSLGDPRERAETIPENHREMCRFSSMDSPGYRKVSREIESMVKSLSQRTKALSDSNQALLKSLHFPEMYQRQKNVKAAMNNTCDWLETHPKFVRWKERANVETQLGLLWIKGKPGAGKSTLVKKAFQRMQDETLPADRAAHQETVAAFFFNARASASLEKTPAGLYRSILHQALQKDRHALDRLTYQHNAMSTSQPQIIWHEEDLQNMLKQVLARSQSLPTTLFIDALDECDETQIRDLLDFFHDLVREALENGAFLQVCFSSRHYPGITLPHCPEIYVESHNREDILRYIESAATKSASVQELKDEILKKSGGIFLWVVLVIRKLTSHGQTRSLKRLQQELKETPPELDQLFGMLFEHVRTEEINTVIDLFRIVLFSKVPMTSSKIHTALAFSRRSYTSLSEWECSADFLESAAKRNARIVELSRGLIELYRSSPDPKGQHANSQAGKEASACCQFIHETVREFFLGGKGFEILKPGLGNVAAEGHLTLAYSCLYYLSAMEPETVAKIGPEDLYVGSETSVGISYARYATWRLLQHASDIAETGADLRPLCQEVEAQGVLTRIASLQLRIPNGEVWAEHTLSPGANMLFAAVESSNCSLAKHLLSMGYDPNIPCSAPLRYPLLGLARITLWYTTQDCLPPELAAYERAFLWAHDRARYRACFGSYFFMWKILREHGADLEVVSEDQRTALHLAVEKGIFLMVRKILDLKPSLMQARDSDGETPLHSACRPLYNRSVIDLLLRRGADLEATSSNGDTPLHIAAAQRDPRAYWQLIERGANDLRLNHAANSPRDLSRRAHAGRLPEDTYVHLAPKMWPSTLSRTQYVERLRQRSSETLVEVGENDFDTEPSKDELDLRLSQCAAKIKSKTGLTCPWPSCYAFPTAARERNRLPRKEQLRYP